MMQEYNILYEDHNVGKAQVRKEGLYYHFYCSCHFERDKLYTIFLSCSGQERSLGVCVPINGIFCLDTRIPIKHIGEGEFVFHVKPKCCKRKEMFCPVDVNIPFAHLVLLDNAYFCKQDDQIGILINTSKADY